MYVNESWKGFIKTLIQIIKDSKDKEAVISLLEALSAKNPDVPEFISKD